MTVALVDLGYGNLGSVAVALERQGARVQVSSDPGELASAERIVLPGVGAAGYAMERIAALGLVETLRTFRRPLLGICLGMQLLFEGSDEADIACLAIIPGRVRQLESAPGRPVPHMGWSRLSVSDPGIGLSDGDYVYFAHSFVCDDGAATCATADYGRTIPAVVRSGNVWGAQFHPERSSAAGANFLAAWLKS